MRRIRAYLQSWSTPKGYLTLSVVFFGIGVAIIFLTDSDEALKDAEAFITIAKAFLLFAVLMTIGQRILMPIGQATRRFLAPRSNAAALRAKLRSEDNELAALKKEVDRLEDVAALKKRLAALEGDDAH